MARRGIPQETKTIILIKSKRRCAFCFGLDNNTDEQEGQIAHINHNNSDNNEDNLVWLCLKHHNKYDSTTSQSKNYTKEELIIYRDKLYEYMKPINTEKKDKENNEKAIFNINTAFNNIGDFYNLKGEYDTTIDEKNRIKIPIMLHEYIGNTIMVTKGINFLIICNNSIWNEMEIVNKERINNLPEKERMDFYRKYLSSAEPLDVDTKTGRIIIKPYLIEYADLKNQCKIICVKNHLEIWNIERYKKYLECIESE